MADSGRDTDRVLVTTPLPGSLDALEAAEIVGGDRPLGRRDMLDLVADVDGLLCLLTDEVDEELLGRAPRLRVVGNVAVGYDNVDVNAATQAGVLVCHTPDVLDDTVADLTVALMLMAARGLPAAERALRAGEWDGWEIDAFLGRDVHGATLGLVGYGRIGRAVAGRAEAFAMQVLHHCRTPTGEQGYVADLDELLAASDIVSLHVPLTATTRHLIGRRELDLMRPTAVLVNTARGPVVDEAALADALHDRRIHAAGLDAYENEPRVHPRLLDAPNAVLLPHVGSASVRTRRRMVELSAESVAVALGGELPHTAINPQAWSGAGG